MFFKKNFLTAEKIKISTYVFLCIFLCFLNTAFSGKYSYILSSKIVNTLNPVVSALGMPLKLFSNFFAAIYFGYQDKDMIAKILNENEKLKNQIIDYKTELEVINAYRNLYQALEEKKEVVSFLHVIRIIEDRNGKFLICKSEQDVSINDLVLDQTNSLAGRVVNYNKTDKIVKVQLIFDKKFSIPAMTEAGSVYGSVVGSSNEGGCLLYFVNENDRLATSLDDKIVTSGEFDIGPKGVKIGKIFFQNNKACVKPFAKINNLSKLVAIRGKDSVVLNFN
jgi:cell shape-determining protein MreC